MVCIPSLAIAHYLRALAAARSVPCRTCTAAKMVFTFWWVVDIETILVDCGETSVMSGELVDDEWKEMEWFDVHTAKQKEGVRVLSIR